MNPHPEVRISKYQLAALTVGLTLLAVGVLVGIKVSLGVGAFVGVGAVGWFCLDIMLSPQVRKDLFGDLFEGSNTGTNR